MLWAGYVVIIEGVASMVTNDRSQVTGREYFGDALRETTCCLEDEGVEVPPLARWDSFWFHDIATRGYAELRPQYSKYLTSTSSRRFKVAFLPLYPVLMRTTAKLFCVDPFTAGLWVSRLSLLLTLVMLMLYQQPPGAGESSNWEPLVAMLAFPSSFILVSVYSESLFLALTLSAFVLTRRQRYLPAALVSLLAGLTRINGLALIPALGVLGSVEWYRNRRSLWPFAPAFGAAAAYGILAGYYTWAFGDPMTYLTIKREFFGSQLCAPWVSVSVGMARFAMAQANHDIGSMYVYLELPCLCLIIGAAIFLLHRRSWSEATFVGASVMLTLVSGSLWGLPRFTVFLFPIFLLLGRLHREWRVLWYSYLLASASVQVVVLVHYVNVWMPAP
ncbi:MAG: hypothetical protein NTW96_24335 [Planctomycetia bacterium]|nr:hypothetical protein [Planctomycetia bacterium]